MPVFCDLSDFFTLDNENERNSKKFNHPIPPQESLVPAKKCKDIVVCLSSSSSSQEPDHP